MTRLHSHIFEHPGLHSIVVPYHDTNDFFYSGHVGTCLLCFLEFRANGWHRMSYFSLFSLVNNWWMMTLTGNHYIIDLITGIIMAHYMYMIGERLSFLSDYKILGMPSEKRTPYFFRPCETCGWGNLDAQDFMSNDERHKMTSI